MHCPQIITLTVLAALTTAAAVPSNSDVHVVVGPV